MDWLSQVLELSNKAPNLGILTILSIWILAIFIRSTIRRAEGAIEQVNTMKNAVTQLSSDQALLSRQQIETDRKVRVIDLRGRRSAAYLKGKLDSMCADMDEIKKRGRDE